MFKINATSTNIDSVTMFTDGACLGNPGPGGYGVILRDDTHSKELSGGAPSTTNNRMELSAVIAGLSALKRKCVVDIYTDSKYVVDAFNRLWIDSWVKNNWKTSTGQAVKNQDLWQQLLELRKLHILNFHWVKGHSGHIENERCDRIAREVAQRYI